VGYERRAVVDLDDTISYTLNRDWDNAEPIQPTIDKINQLYDLGWEVYIVTARGQLSCNGDSAAADKKYRTQVEAWLKKHGVKYTMLSFNKFLAAYYVDDKMLSPEAFAQLDIEVLREGQSGAVVERRGDRIFKTGDRVKDEAAWYLLARSMIPGYVPEVYSFVGSTLSLEFIKNSPPRLLTGAHLDAIKALLVEMSAFRSQSDAGIDTMLDRVKKHLDGWPASWSPIEKSNHLYDTLDHVIGCLPWGMTTSFSHGDLSLDNLLWTDHGVKLIDPIFDLKCYSSIVFDAGKLLHSLGRQRRSGTLAEARPIMTRLIMDRFGIDGSDTSLMLRVAEIIQWIRIVKYIRSSTERDDAIQTIWSLEKEMP